MDRLYQRFLRVYFPVAAALTVAAAIAWIAVQTSTRNAGNRPQEQLADRSARRLDRGISWRTVAGGRIVDLANSAAPPYIGLRSPRPAPRLNRSA